MTSSPAWAAPAIAALLTLGSCSATHDAPDTGADVENDAGWPAANGLDLLFVVESYGNMAVWQEQLIEQVDPLLAALTSGDIDRDGVPDMAPIESVHIGVLSTDLGAGPHEGVPTCAPGLGDGGVLQDRSAVPLDACPMESSRFLVLERGTDRAEVTHRASCLLRRGMGSCGFEQMLEPTLRALMPSRWEPWMRDGFVPPRFLDERGVVDAQPGHGDGLNAGFLRPDSALAIVVLHEEDDCSVRDYGLFVAADPRFSSVPLLLRCWAFESSELGVVQPIERYVEGLLGLRRDPRLLVFASIGGVPPDAVGPAEEPVDFERIAAHPGMTRRTNDIGTNLVESCASSRGRSYPPVRILGLAERLAEAGAGVSVAAICDEDYASARDALLRVLAPVFPRR